MYVLSYCHAHSAWMHFSASFAVFLYLFFFGHFYVCMLIKPNLVNLKGPLNANVQMQKQSCMECSHYGVSMSLGFHSKTTQITTAAKLRQLISV